MTTLAEISEERQKARQCEKCDEPITKSKLCDNCERKAKEVAKNFQDLSDSVRESIRSFALSGQDKNYNEKRRMLENIGYKFKKDGTLK